jgi:hypothetical protein
MKESNYTSLKVSKAIASQVDVESEVWWNEKTGKLTRKPKRFKYAHHFNEGGSETESKSYRENMPALTLSDCMKAIQMLGEKKGWEEICCGCREYADDCDCEVSFYPSEPRYTHEQHQLLDAFNADNADNMDMRGENVSKFLLELFTEEK